LMVTLVTKALRRSGTMRSIAGAGHVQVERGESGKKSEVARAPQQGVTKYLSFGCSFSRPWPPVRTTHATPRNRFVLGRASTSRRSPGVRSLPAVEHQAARAGASATIARTDCRPRSEHHPHPIGNGHMRLVPTFAACAANPSIASAGTSICGRQG
jgi:hypothetical protein